MKTTKRTRNAAKRLFRLCLVNGLLDTGRTRQVVQSIIKAKRRGGLALLSYFRRLVKLDSEQHAAQIESAIPLPAELRAKIQTDLKNIYGLGISASFVHNPNLIGGMRIKVGCDVYDGSISGRLAALEKSF